MAKNNIMLNGSIEVVDDSLKYELQGYYKDRDKLPMNIGAGSTFFALDTSQVFVFHSKSKTWVLLNKVTK